MGVARRGLDLRVAEQLADHRQALTRGDCRRREGVAQVVDADVLDAGAGADALPEGLQIAQALARQGAEDDPRVAFDALGVAEQVDGGLTEMDDLRAGLGIRQAQDALGQIDVRPLQCHDLVQPAAGQDQQAGGEDGRRQFDPLCLHLAQHLADPAQFRRAEKAFALLLGILPDVLSRVGAVRTQPPHLGQAEHLRDHFEAAVRLIGDVTHVVMELRHVRPGDARDRQLPERGQDESFEVAAILLGRARLHADRDVLLVEPLGQLLHRDRPAPRVPLGGGVRAIARGGDNGDGAVAGLLAGQDRAGPEADPPGSASGAILDHVALAPTRQHAQPEARDLAVPDEVFDLAGFCSVDEAFGDLGHGALRWFFRRSTVLKRGRQSTNTLKSRIKRKWRAVPRRAFQRADAGNRRARRIRTQVPAPAVR